MFQISKSAESDSHPEEEGQGLLEGEGEDGRFETMQDSARDFGWGRCRYAVSQVWMMSWLFEGQSLLLVEWLFLFVIIGL